MKQFDYNIYGGGPTGLTLAYILAKNNKSVRLIEKESQLGGCWKVEWQGKYYTEHSPRVLIDDNSSFFKLLKQINFNYKKETVNTYGNMIQTKYKLSKFFLKNISVLDYIKIISGFFSTNNLTVSEWVNKNNISKSGKKVFEIYSILISNSPDKLLIADLFNSFSNSNLLQFTDNTKWLNLLKKELLRLNVTILVNHSLEKLIYDKNTNKIVQGIVINRKIWSTNGYNIFAAKNHLITFPPKAMVDFLENQNIIIRNNWEEIKNYKLNSFLKNCTYYSFGFQLHFTETIQENPNLDFNKKDWCWSCQNEYNLIILPTSQYQKVFSKDEKIKTVWSCTIVDTNKFITKFNKTINQMTKSEIINDIIDILKVKPYKITFYDGLHKDNNIWISKDSSFSPGKINGNDNYIIKSKGHIYNLEWIGSHNSKGHTTINKVVNNVISWSKNNNFNTFNLQNNNNNLIFKIIIFLLISYSINYLYRNYLN